MSAGQLGDERGADLARCQRPADGICKAAQLAERAVQKDADVNGQLQGGGGQGDVPGVKKTSVAATP